MLEVGKEYTVTHRRKGTFKMRVVSENDVFVTGVIVEGRARSLSYKQVLGVGVRRDNWEESDEVTVRKSLAEFEEVS